MVICGIDYSMSSPALCVYDTKKKLEFNNTQVFVYSDKTKLIGTYNKNIHIMKHIPYESQMERFDNISEWSMSIMNKFGVKEVCIENYSLGSKGAVFDIAENGGILKHKLYKAGINIISPAPTQVKKCFTGKGNANKEAMHNAFIERESLSIVDILGITSKNAYESPVSDIVDSYAMVQFFVNNR